MDAKETKKNKKGSPVWLTVVLCFIMVMLGLGMWAPKSLFVVPISSALNISRSLYSITETMRYVSTAIINIFFGSMVAKFGAKKLICAGFVALIASAILYAVAGGLIVLYLGGILVGIGLSWTGTTIVGYIINKVCTSNRGTVMGFILAANGIGGAITTQIINAFLKDETNPFAYRRAFYFMAIVFAVVLLILILFLKEPKAEESEQPEQKKNTHGAGWIGVDYKEATKKTYFYGVLVCIFLAGIVLQSTMGIYAAHMTDVGFNKDFIALVGSISLIGLAFFKFVNGFMYDRVGLRFTVTVDGVIGIAAMLCLYFITDSVFGMALGIMYAVFASAAHPMETVLLPIYANDLFGEKSFNKVLGIFVSVNQVGFALGGPIINLCYDVFKSYNLALIICAILMFIIVIILQFVINSAYKVKLSIINSNS